MLLLEWSKNNWLAQPCDANKKLVIASIQKMNVTPEFFEGRKKYPGPPAKKAKP